MVGSRVVLVLICIILFGACEEEADEGDVEVVHDALGHTGPDSPFIVEYKVINNSNSDVLGWNITFRVTTNHGDDFFCIDSYEEVVEPGDESYTHRAEGEYPTSDIPTIFTTKLFYFDYY